METYYNPEDLAKFSPDGVGEGAPELWDLYMAYYGKVFAEGELTAREKALIALAVAAAVQCPYCMEMGVTKEQMTEAFHVANAIRGGAALAHGVQMVSLVDKLEM